MSRRVAVLGAGMGGLTAALRLARHGYRVTVLEARAAPGGLAGGLELDGFPFDAGPYILLDRPGLEWAFRLLQEPRRLWRRYLRYNPRFVAGFARQWLRSAR